MTSHDIYKFKTRDQLIHELTEVQTQFAACKQREAAQQEAVQNYDRQLRLFEGIASTTPDFAYLFDLDGRFLYANRRLLEVWGMHLADVIGSNGPEMDGIEATRHIKTEFPGIRIIGLSMHLDEHIIRNMREAGAENFVGKTASSTELLKAI